MSEPWFAPKQFGYGTGLLPVRWQGWVVLTAYFLVLFAGLYAAQHGLTGGARNLAALAAFAVPTIIFIVVTRAKTEGDWHWRWGGR